MDSAREMAWGDIDPEAMLQVEHSLTDGMDFVIGGLGPVRTGFGLRLHVPLSEAQMDDPGRRRDPGAFLELTYAQAADLSAKLAARLAERSSKEG